MSKVTALNPNKSDWKDQIERSDRGRPLSNAYNVKLIFENDKNLAGKFGYNIFTYKQEITGSVPWKRIQEVSGINDTDDSCLRNYFSINYGIKAKDIIQDGLTEIAAANQFHPVREYLNSIRGKWDGKKRVDTLLIDFFDSEDSELVRFQTRLTLVAAIKRVFQPGCKFDYVLTLKGEQGKGKSTFLKKLAVNPDWFSDSIEDFSKGKEAKEQLLGKWIIELGEMAAVGAGDQKRTKQFITSTTDEYRQAYGKRTSSYPRQNIFVASTNDELPLKDDTGGRRWWIVDIHSNWMDKDKPLEINQIWAEALEIYEYMEREDIPLTLPGDLEQEARKKQTENTDRGLYAAEIEHALSNGYIEQKDYDGIKKIPFSETCAFHVWEKILGYYKRDLTKAQAREINATLKSMEGWENIGRREFKPYGKQTVYKRIE